MSPLLSFGVMSLAGVCAAFVYDVFRAMRRALDKVFISKGELRKMRGVIMPVQDVLTVAAAFLFFILGTYICASGELRGYIILGFACGCVLYAGVVTHFTGNLVYLVLCAILHVTRFTLYTVPQKFKKIIKISRRGAKKAI